MKAVQLAQERFAYAEDAFVEIVVWRIPAPLRGSTHLYKYRLAFVVSGAYVLRYDKEAGKGDHRHLHGREYDCTFRSIEQVLVDFNAEVRRLNDEDSDT